MCSLIPTIYLLYLRVHRTFGTLEHEIRFEGFVTAPKYSCDSTINRKMTSYEALTSSDVLISRSDNRLDNFIRLLLNSPLESHWIRGLKLTSKFRAVQFWVNWKKMTTKSERRTSVSSSTVCNCKLHVVFNIKININFDFSKFLKILCHVCLWGEAHNSILGYKFILSVL